MIASLFFLSARIYQSVLFSLRKLWGFSGICGGWIGPLLLCVFAYASSTKSGSDGCDCWTAPWRLLRQLGGSEKQPLRSILPIARSERPGAERLLGATFMRPEGFVMGL